MDNRLAKSVIHRMRLFLVNKSFRETIKTVSGKAEKVRELIVGPRVIEFENGITLETSIRGEKPDMKLKKDDEILLDFNAMMPENVVLEFSPKGEWGPEGSTVENLTLYVGRFKDVDAILLFFHEIGHLNNIEDLDLVSRLRQIAAKEALKDTANAFPDSRLRAVAEERKWTIKIERDAWAFALKKARELESGFGIKIFNRLEGKGKVWKKAADFVNSHLQRYEDTYLHQAQHFDIYSEEEMEAFFDQLLAEPEPPRT